MSAGDAQWAEEFLRRKSEAKTTLSVLPKQGSRAGSSGDGGGGGEDLEVSEEQLDVAHAALLELRRAAILSASPATIDFVPVVRGGEWTLRKTGNISDMEGARVRGKDATDWCKEYGLNQSMTLSRTERGHDVIARLGDEWSRKMQYFYNEYKTSTVLPFRYSVDVLAGYVEMGDYAAWADSQAPKSKAGSRVAWIRELAPSVDPLDSGASSSKAKRRKA